MKNPELIYIQKHFFSPFEKKPKNYFFLFSFYYYYIHLYPFFTFDENMSNVRTWADFDNYVYRKCHSSGHEILLCRYSDFQKLPDRKIGLLLRNEFEMLQILLRTGLNKNDFAIWSKEFRIENELEELNSRLFLLFAKEIKAMKELSREIELV